VAFLRAFFAGINDAATPTEGHIPARINIVEEFPENEEVIPDVHVAVIEKNQVKWWKDIGIQQLFGKIDSGKTRRFLDLQYQNPIATDCITFQDAKRQYAFAVGLNAGKERILVEFFGNGNRPGQYPEAALSSR